MEKIILYARKSSDEGDKKQLLSLQAQERELRDFARRERLNVVDYLEEERTAKEPGRKVFNAMLDRIEKGEANAIGVRDIDRLYRNPVDEGRVRWMLQRGVIVCIRTPGRAFYPADAGLLMGVEGGRATDYVIRLSRGVATGLKEKAHQGEWPGRAPLGYIYDRNKRNIVPDPKWSKVPALAYSEFSSGRVGLSEISARLADLGVTRGCGQPWSKSQVSKFLTNKLYIGIMVWNGAEYEGKFERLVSPELFARVRAVLRVRSKPRRSKQAHRFPFCGIARCPCGSMITGQWATGRLGGRYRYCRCARSHGPCRERYVQERDLVDRCLALLKPLALSTKEADQARQMVEEERLKGEGVLDGAIAAIDDRVASTQSKLNRLTRSYIDEVIDLDSYNASKSELLNEKVSLKAEKERLRQSHSPAWIEPSLQVISALEMAAKQQTDRSAVETSLLVHKIGLNPVISGRRISFGFAPPYDSVAELLGEEARERELTSERQSISPLTSSLLCRLVHHLQTWHSGHHDARHHSSR